MYMPMTVPHMPPFALAKCHVLFRTRLSSAEEVRLSCSQVIITRQGSALSPSDLERVSAGSARTVILTTPAANTEEEVSKVSWLTAVAKLYAL
jgi:hypothetical protein